MTRMLIILWWILAFALLATALFRPGDAYSNQMFVITGMLILALPASLFVAWALSYLYPYVESYFGSAVVKNDKVTVGIWVTFVIGAVAQFYVFRWLCARKKHQRSDSFEKRVQ